MMRTRRTIVSAMLVLLSGVTTAAQSVAPSNDRADALSDAARKGDAVAVKKLYLASEDGDVFVVKAGAAYELLATNKVGQVLTATPAISDGTLIIRGLKDVFAIRQKS